MIQEHAEEKERRINLVYTVTQLASQLMALDMLEQDKPMKEVLKNIQAYLPKDLLNNPAEKLLGKFLSNFRYELSSLYKLACMLHMLRFSMTVL